MCSVFSMMVIPCILAASGRLPYPVVICLYILMAVMVSTSIPVIIITRMLKRGNAMSDDIVGFDTYGGYIDESAHLNKIDPRKIDYFVAEYAKSPFADGTDGDGWTETDDIFGDLPEVDKPLFAPTPPSGLQ